MYPFFIFMYKIKGFKSYRKAWFYFSIISEEKAQAQTEQDLSVQPSAAPLM